MVCGREIEALSSSKRNREKIQNLLGDMEGNVLDNANLSTNLLELRKELGMIKKLFVHNPTSSTYFKIYF